MSALRRGLLMALLLSVACAFLSADVAPHLEPAGVDAGVNSPSAVHGYDYDPPSKAMTRTAMSALVGNRDHDDRWQRARTRSFSSAPFVAPKAADDLPPIRGGAPGSSPDEVLRPGGSPIGRSGTSSGIRRVDSEDQLDEVFDKLASQGAPTQRNYPGSGYDLPGGGFVGKRQSADHGPTLDIDVPGFGDVRKIHVGDL